VTEGHRASKGQRRIGAILRDIPAVREQLLVAIEGFGPDFAEGPFVAAAQSSDALERNRVTAWAQPVLATAMVSVIHNSFY
jgi:hypothetical protein